MMRENTTRREVLSGGIAVLGGVSVAGCATSVAEKIPSGGSENAPNEQSFRFSSNFEKIQFLNLGKILEVTATQDHAMDAFGLAHASQTDANSWIENWEAPQFKGPKRIAFLDALQDYDAVFPSRKFKLIAFRGSSGTVFYLEEILGSVTFTFPKSYGPSELFANQS
jgi:hypothetical protein